MLSLRGYARVWSINFRVQVVMLVMLVKPADTSPHECASTYFQTGLRTFLNICRVQSFAEHPAHRIASRSWTLQPLIKYQVKLKESMFIKWEKPDLNQQVKHINLTLSL